jgi:hypothetical protein
MRACPWLLVVSLASCESDADHAEKNRQQFIADEAACKDEIAHHDSWSNTSLSTTSLSERCQRVANVYAERRKRDDAVAARKQSDDMDRSASANCDPKARDKRDRWIDTKVTEDDWTSSPRDEGFRIDGQCGQKLTVQALDCSDSSIATVFHDMPWIREAARLGFTRFVCNEVDHLSKDGGAVFKRVVEKPIAAL